jgi:hypothetical protein
MTDLAPIDDAFIRTAIRGLRPPDHHRAFWDDLGGELDAIAQVLVAQGLLVDQSVAPLVVELPHAAAPAAQPQRPVEPPARAADPTLVRPRRQPLRAAPPAHVAPADAPRVRAFGPDPSGWAHPGTPTVPEVVVRHDPAVVPRSLRRTSNAVLLAVAIAAAVVALVAGLSLVRQRADNAGPAPTPEAPQAVGATS